MKKIFSLLLALMLCVAGIAVAENEEFQLRNGIFFGDTVEVVKQKETLEIRTDSQDKTDLIWYDGIIAEISGSIRYDFDNETGKLIDMKYTFDALSDKNIIDNDYEKIRKSLIRKYGPPIGNTGGTIELITGSAFDQYASDIFIINLLGGTGDVRDYDEWIVDSNGYHVKIDFISYYTRDEDHNYIYNNAISYHYYTDEDYLNALKEKQNENAAIDSEF